MLLKLYIFTTNMFRTYLFSLLSIMATHYVPLHFFCLSLVTILQSTLAAQSENYIIHMDSSAMPKAFSGHHDWYLSTLATISDTTTATATATEIPYSSKLIYSYTHVMKGFSASLTPSELEVLKTTPGYIFSIKDIPVKKDTTHTSQFLGLNPFSGAWPASKYGQDVIVGLVDTGVWPESESYNDEGMNEVPLRWKGTCQSGTQFNSSMCNKKLIGARYFNRGLIAQLPKNVTIKMNSTRDIEGHGTHTSSTAAGNYVKGASYYGYASGTATGVAPRAHVAMYKALWAENQGPNVASDVIAAIDQAISDGVDVLSMSFGYGGVPLYSDPVAMATFAAIEKGIFVSTSAGNAGPFIENLHNGIPWVLTVAAGTIDREFAAVLGLGNGVKVSGSAIYTGDYNSIQYPIVFMDECKNSIELNKTGDKIVVCEEKNETLSDQLYNVMRANVTGGIFITNSTVVAKVPFPAIFTKVKNGETIKDYIKTNKEPKASLEFGITKLGTKPQPTVTDYSSRGPSQSCPFVLKPDIMAPGDMILAAWPSNIPAAEINSELQFSNFNLMSGTSMACPHAAGVGALLKSAHPEWSPAAIRSAMMTTADVTDNTQRPIKDSGHDFKTASPIAMGAGHVNPNKALDPGLIYDVDVNDYVNLLCGLGFTAKQIQAITRSSTSNCSAPTLDLNYPSFIAFFNVNDSKSDVTIVKEFKRTVTNVGEGMSKYIAKLPALEGLKVSVTPDKLVFKEKNEKQSYKLRIEGPKLMKEEQAFGFLRWEAVGGKYEVKSPIVATNINSDITG